MSYNLPTGIDKKQFSNVLEDIRKVNECTYCSKKVSKSSPLICCYECSKEQYRGRITYCRQNRYEAYRCMLNRKYEILDDIHNDLIKYFITRYNFQCRDIIIERPQELKYWFPKII